ncbi:hypothetical protein DEU56DRAFT_913520 [Suillus clintonianus]|uniref:uncharacterized protein n=1 Tax=Suillus clintonianus TaxID=1904413 RepID=UPI001B8802E9|nr:uncharacterized protein DEU56DRAFT_913520 [Suillus clintonianus]KAG2135149.1 hypothetical protein DEU56DRAFT_913520 [Suillus clintonianus]
MTYVSNDPAWWPLISYAHFIDYFEVASATVVVYDWALTFTQEVELIWRQRWSFMTVLYICVRYIGILYSFNLILCNTLYFIAIWEPVVVNAMLGVIMMARIHAMYGQSKIPSTLLAVLLLVSTIATGVMAVIANLGFSGGEAVLSGYHVCAYRIDIDATDLNDDVIIPTAIWEILNLFLAVWIVIKHLRDLRQLQRGSIIEDCFVILIRSHALYFLAFVLVACFTLGGLSPSMMNTSTWRTSLYNGILNIAQVFQMFVLGPRLILDVREYNAKLVARSDEGTHMTSLAFRTGGDALTGGDV